MNIWDIEHKILNNVRLAENEIAIVERAIYSEDIEEKVLACEAFLRLGNAEQSRRACVALSEIVREANRGSLPLIPNIVMAFLHVPAAVLMENPFQECLECSGTHPDEGVRTNCMAVLGILAKSGLPWVKKLLEAGLEDTSQLVRQNATAGLRLTLPSPPSGGSTPPSGS